MAVFSTPLTIALVSVSASAQDVDNLRCYGAYTLIIEHHVQALVVGNRSKSGSDNRLLFGALVLEAAALHQLVPVLTRSLLSAARLPRLASPTASIRHPLV